jgi:hypothetical protein
MKDIMVDIETLGTAPGSVITQIGACYFDRRTGETGEQFSVNIRVQDCLDCGLTVSGDTIRWWFGQGNPTWLKDGVDLRCALERFHTFAKKADFAWSHATFDFPVLYYAYHRLGIGVPVHYRGLRDIRTLVDLAGVPRSGEKNEHSHDALSDCLFQVKYCMAAFRKLSCGDSCGQVRE